MKEPFHYSALERIPRPWVLALCLMTLPLRRMEAEDRADFKFSYYLEDHSRTEAISPALLIQTDLTPNTVLTIESVYDVISGATPTGEPPRRNTREVVTTSQVAGATSFVAVAGPSGRGTTLVPVATSSTVTETTLEEYGKPFLPMAEYEDERWALNVGLRHRHGEWVFEGGMAYSTESDYQSVAGSLLVSRDFNERMTTLTAGVSLTHDDVLDAFTERWENKDSIDGQIQLAQVIDPNTLLKVSFVAGTSHGFLNDQYKYALVGTAAVPEQRPDQRDKEVVYLSLNRFIEPLDAAIEASYRFYNDSYGIEAHTVGLEWYQNLGKRFILVPNVRYYEQSAADFFDVKFPEGAKTFSSDYRLSKLGSVTYGAKLIWKASDKFWADIAYDRYSMFGRNGDVPGEAYPEANIVTVGFKIWF